MYEIQQISKQSNQQIIFLKTFVVWLIIIFAEMRHGTARVLWLEPFFGEFRARQIAVFIGSGIILAIAISLIRWIGTTNIPQLLVIGVLWLCLTVGFELLLGRLVMGLSWARIASEYNLLQGGLMPIGLLFLTLSPLIAAKLRGTVEYFKTGEIPK